MRKVSVIGGGGVRTPLLIHAIAQARELNIGELALFDVDPERTGIIAGLGREIVRKLGSDLVVRTASTLEDAADGADFVLNSIRVGGMAARARDERIAIEHGFAGQETTGPGGAAMALRTIPVSLSHARIVERVAPRAWFINFTNPAGLMTQALMANTHLKVIGICDTPSELFQRISEILREPRDEVRLEYAGLNHLGWVSRVSVGGRDVMERLLADEESLRKLYPADLFDPLLIQTLRLIPSEYLFFYYGQRKAYENQLRAGASRGEELARLNTELFCRLAAEDPREGLETYTNYLLLRNASYLKLEAEGGSAFDIGAGRYNPFETATGYHRIALDVMSGLVSDRAREVVVNVRNDGAIEDLAPEDIVEVPCEIDSRGARPAARSRLPEAVRGLVLAVKAYERCTIRAALEGSISLARLALLEYPIVGQWEPACNVLDGIISTDPAHLGYLT
jgi:6-phospho-beta-glucosidase